MKVEKEKNKKVFVDQKGVAALKCPLCSLEKSTRVNSQGIREKNIRDNCIVRCKCQTRFAVTLEFRRDFRKLTNLTGEYICLPKGKTRGILKVINLSESGFGLEVTGSNQLKMGDELLVLFNLDDTNGTLIEKTARVRFVKESYIGCNFIGSSPLGKALGGYLKDESPQNEQIELSEADHSEADQFDWDSPRYWR